MLLSWQSQMPNLGQDTVISSTRLMSYAQVSTRVCSSRNLFLQIQLQETFPEVFTRDWRLNSYLALGGPAWLHNRLQNEALSNIC
ncbi:unnamed protein product [Brassica oleracea]